MTSTRRLLIAALSLAAFVPAVRADGYKVRTEYTEVTVDTATQETTEKKVEMTPISLGDFDLTGDTIGRFNSFFENNRVLSAPAYFKDFRVSCDSIRQDEKHVKILVFVEKIEGDSWKLVAAASSVAEIGTPVIRVSAIPATEGFEQGATSVKYNEFGVVLTLGEDEPAPGKKKVTFNIPFSRHEETPATR